MFRRKEKHDLPKFPEHVIPTFQQLCQALAPSDIGDVRAAVEQHVLDLQSAKAEVLHVNLKLGREIGEVLTGLLDQYESFDEKQRALVIGAAAYFVHQDDPQGDTTFGTGLNDDAKVVNYVLNQLGIEDKFLKI